MSGKILEKAVILWVPVAGLAAVLLHHALFLYWHAVNIPYADDIFDMLGVLSATVQSNDPSQTFGLLYAQYFNHRTLSNRLIHYLVLLVTGEVNFRTTVFLANLVLPLLLLLLFLTIRQQTYRWWILLSAALILFGLRTYELTLWTAPMDDMYVYVYAFAALICLRQARWVRFAAAVVFASLATFTLANGQLIWLVGLISLLHRSLVLRRATLIYVYGWLLSAGIVLSLWHLGFDKGYSASTVLGMLLKAPLHPIAYFLSLMGNAVSGSSTLVATSVGCGLLFLIGYSSVRRFREEDLTLEFFAWFIVLSLLTITFGRAPLTAIEYALSSRYALPSSLLLILVVAALAHHVSLRWQNMGTYFVIFLLCALHYGASFQTYRPALQHMLEKRVASYNRGKYWAFGSSHQETTAVVMTAVADGIYTEPPRPHPLPSIAPSSK